MSEEKHFKKTKYVFLNVWLGWQDSNLRVRESKSRALPLGDTPVKVNGAGDKFRTCYLQSHNLALYRLSYARHILGAPGETRTPDTRLRRPLLYPAELRAHKHICCAQKLRHFGAGDGNRTHATSLEG